MLNDPLCSNCQRPTVVGFREHLRHAPLAAIRAAEAQCARCKRVARRRLPAPPPRLGLRTLLAGLLRP